MKTKHIAALIVFLVTQFYQPTTHAQTEFKGSAIVPSNPTSTDSVTYVRNEPRRFCSRLEPFHKVAMVNNDITITFGDWYKPLSMILPPPDDGYRPTDLVDLGRLPPGDYTLSTIGAQCTVTLSNEPSPPDVSKLAFKVSDARPKKNYFGPTIDYSGHWWDENDAGWGLFIWQDSANNVLAAWFTYTPDGKPAWYVFQPIWAAPYPNWTHVAEVWQTSKPPGTISPPVGTTKFTTVGTASLNFYFGQISPATGGTPVEQFAKFTYKLGDGATQTRTLKRFKAN